MVTGAAATMSTAVHVATLGDGAPVEVTVVRRADDVAGLGDAWDRLDAHPGAPVLSHDWVVSAVEHLSESGDPLIVCVFESDELVGAAPLWRSRKPFARLELLGQRHHGEPGGFVYRDAPSLRRLLDALASLRLPMVLRSFDADRPVLDGLRHTGGCRVVTRSSRSCPTLEIPAGATGLDRVLSASLRSDLRRARRRAERIGAVAFEMHTPASPDDLRPLWDEVLRVEAAGWKGRSGTALRHHEALGAFFSAYARRSVERKELRIGLLEIGGVAAAAVVAVEAGNRLWLLKIGYDERFAAASPGMLVLEGSLTDAVGRALRSMEFLGTATPWTRRWTSAERPFAAVRVYPHTPLGAAWFGWDAARSLGRRFLWREGRS